MTSLIDEFNEKCRREIDEYFDAIQVDTNMHSDVLNTKLALIKDLKMPNHQEEAEEFFKNLSYEQWVHEIDLNPDALFNLALYERFSLLSKQELEQLALYTFEEYGVINDYIIKFMTNKYINNNEKIRHEIISGDLYHHIEKLNDLTNNEKITALSNNCYFTINKILRMTPPHSEKMEFIRMFICLDGEITKVENWKDYLDGELISLVIAMSGYQEEYVDAIFNTHPAYTMSHVYALIKSKPSAVKILLDVESDFGDIYLQTEVHPEKEHELLVKSYLSMKEKPFEYSVLFKGKNPIVTLESYCQAYKELYV